MKELENGKKKLLITGNVHYYNRGMYGGILLTAVIKTIRKRRQKYRKKVYSAHHRNSPLRHKKSRNRKPGALPRQNCRRHFPRHQSRDESIAASEAESREQAQKEAEEASIAQEKAEQEAREEQERQAQGAGLAERLAGYETVSRRQGQLGILSVLTPDIKAAATTEKSRKGRVHRR